MESLEDNTDNSIYGPALPPQTKKQHDKEYHNPDQFAALPKLPSAMKASPANTYGCETIGPVLPPVMKEQLSGSGEESLTDDIEDNFADSHRRIVSSVKGEAVVTETREGNLNTSYIGPSLPPGYKRSQQDEITPADFTGPKQPLVSKTSQSWESSSQMGPALFPDKSLQQEKVTLSPYCGPALPPDKSLHQEKVTLSPYCGPALPPDKSFQQEKVTPSPYCGPALPPDKSLQQEKVTPSPYCGPALPPDKSLQQEKVTPSPYCGPALPPDKSLQQEKVTPSPYCGPALPPDKSLQQEKVTLSPYCGPALPPDKSLQQEKVTPSPYCGPPLPPGYKSSNQESSSSNIGPSLPPGFKREETILHKGAALPPRFPDGDNPLNTIGPLPSEMVLGCTSSAASEFEERAQKMKEFLTEKPSADDGPAVRDTWMTELPSQMGKSIGLNMQARNFRKRVIPDSDRDASGWTDTPADRERKAKEKEERRSKVEEEYHHTKKSSKDERNAKELKKHKKSKHKDSLLEMHQKERKKKKKKEKEKPKERRPFDRDTDLQVNRFDDAKRKAIIQRSQELNTKFSNAGSTSSFL